MTPDEDFQAVFESTQRKLAALAPPTSGARPRLAVVQRDQPAAQDTVPIEAAPDAPDWETNWLPRPVADWVDAVSTAYAVPKVMGIAAALCAAATLVQGKVRVRVKPGWEEPLSLFWLVFSPTASMKSAVLGRAVKPIEDMQAELEAERAPILKANKRRKAMMEGRLKKIHGIYASKGAISEDCRHELDILVHDIEECDIRPAPVWLYDDINPALVLTKMRRNLESTDGIARVAVLDAEGTFMANLLGRHSGHIDVSSLLKGYMGEAVRKTRASRSSDEEVDTRLPESFFTMLLMVQPHILDQMRGVDELADNGLMGRCLVTQLPGRAVTPPADAPVVPAAVQASYAAWLRELERIPEGSVVDLSEHFEPGGAMRTLYDTVGADLEREQGAAGWSKRSVGRVARIVALSELSQLSHCPEGGARGSRMRGEIKIKILTYLLYSRALSSAQAREPHTDPLTTLTHRALRWLRQSTVATVGSFVTLRTLTNALHLKKSVTLQVCDSLVESGHLAMGTETHRRNHTLTVTYQIISLDPEAKPAPRLEIVPDDQGPPPDWMDQ